VYRILDVLVHLTAPILSFTAEEIWQYMPNKERRPESIFLSPMPEPDGLFSDEPLAERWDLIFKERAEVLKALEEARNSGIIGHSLDAKVSLYPDLYKKDLSLNTLAKNGRGTPCADVLIVSRVDVDGTEDPGDTAAGALLERTAEPLGGADESGVRAAKARYGSPLFGGPIVVSKAQGTKCERCWKYDIEVGRDAEHPTVCRRCAAVLRSGVSA
jgi:isoleucyl-tRNA synthetase